MHRITSLFILVSMGLLGCTESTAVVLSSLDGAMSTDGTALPPDGAVALPDGRVSPPPEDAQPVERLDQGPLDGQPMPRDQGPMDAEMPSAEDQGPMDAVPVAEDQSPMDQGPVDRGPVNDAAPPMDLEYCDRTGLPRLTTADMACVGEVAPQLFAYGLCACDSITLGGGLTIRGDTVSGTNGRYSADGALNVTGDFTIANQDSANFVVATDIGGTLRSDAHVNANGNLNVGGDAYIDGRLTVQQDLQINGTLVQPAGSDLIVTGEQTIGRREQGAVRVDPPCPCDVDLSVLAETQPWRNENDNVSIGLFPGDLNPADRPLEVEMPCGRYYFEEINNREPLTFEIQGRVQLYIERDLLPEAPFEIRLAPGAELDIYLGGYVVTGEPVTLGDPARPNALRWYVEPTGQTLAFDARFDFSGHLVAPGTVLRMQDPGELTGSLLVRDLNTTRLDTELTVDEAPPQCMR